MFFKKIFKPKQPAEPAVENLSLEVLREKVDKLKQNEIESVRPKLNSLFDKMVEEKKIILDDLKTLSATEPTEEIHPNLYKMATEARKLFIDKMNRALSDFNPQRQISAENLSELDLDLAKFVNFTTQTITTQGRQVGVVFGAQIKSIQFHVQQLQSFIKDARNHIQTSLEKIGKFVTLLSRVQIQIELRQQIPELDKKIKALEEQKGALEKALAEDSAHMKKLAEGEEFKRVENIEREIQKIELEKSHVKNSISSTFSGLDRPLRKMEKLIVDGRVAVDRDLAKVLQPCLHDPVAVVMSDQKIADAKKLFKQVLKSINSGGISLNDRERTKREEILTEIIEGNELEEAKRSLEALREKLASLSSEKSKFTISKQMAELERKMERNRSALKDTQTKIEESIQKSMVLKQESEKGIAEIEKSAREVVGQQIRLTF